MRRPALLRWAAAATGVLLALVAAAAVIGWAALQALSPPRASGASSVQPPWTLPIGVTLLGHRIEREASVPVLLRLATHPLAAPLIDGRSIATAHGRWQLEASSAGVWARCAPCRVRIDALGPSAIELDRVELTVAAEGADHYRGSLTLGGPPQALRLPWRGRVDRDGTMHWQASLAPTPLQHAVRVFGRDLPERAVVEVDGSLALALDARLPRGPWRVEPRVQGFAVRGLGTEALLDLQRPAACREGREAGVGRVGGWLPRAVIAAEDQRFFEHPGYDLDAMVRAWRHNQAGGATLAGASTLSQQLAKLVVAGDERSASRKLRELLYAVEMERTLGKARVLQLYLALAPWGEGVCGAERAARVHLGQRDASALGPVAAAWLASLLPAPDALLRQEQARGEVDTARVARVIEGLRPMAADRREKALTALLFWSPPGLARRDAPPPEPLDASTRAPAPPALDPSSPPAAPTPEPGGPGP